jgi:hypothetical protein
MNVPGFGRTGHPLAVAGQAPYAPREVRTGLQAGQKPAAKPAVIGVAECVGVESDRGIQNRWCLGGRARRSVRRRRKSRLKKASWGDPAAG